MKNVGGIVVVSLVMSGCASRREEMKFNMYQGEFVRVPIVDKRTRLDDYGKMWGAWLLGLAAVAATDGQIYFSDCGYETVPMMGPKNWFIPCNEPYNFREIWK